MGVPESSGARFKRNDGNAVGTIRIGTADAVMTHLPREGRMRPHIGRKVPRMNDGVTQFRRRS